MTRVLNICNIKKVKYVNFTLKGFYSIAQGKQGATLGWRYKNTVNPERV